MPTASDILDQHVTLRYRSVDRLFLNGYIPLLQTPGALMCFLERDGPIASPALLQRRSDAFVRDLKAYAAAHEVPWIAFARKERKEERIRPLFRAAERAGRSGLVAVGVAQERMNAWHGRPRPTPRGSVTFDWSWRSVCVNHFYLYILDGDCGPSFIKIAGYAPWGIRVWLNGHEWLKRQLARRGVAFGELDNGIRSCERPEVLTDLAARFGPAEVRRYFARWMAELPQPLTAADRAAGHGHALSMLQVEVSDTAVFDRPVRGRQWFEAQIPQLLTTGRPGQIGLLFERRVQKNTPSRFKTEVVSSTTLPTIRFTYKHSAVKQYLKEGRALRTETTFGDPYDVGIGRRLDNLPKLIERGQRVNAKLLELEAAVDDARLAGPELTCLTRPVRDERGRRTAALRLGDLRVMALLAALVAIFARHLAAGFGNAQLRRIVADLLGVPLEEYTSAKMTYDLGRLAGHGLIAGLPRTRRYQLTPFGLRAAAFLTELADRVLDPGIARCASPPPSPEHSVWRSLERALDEIVHHAGLAA
ncbi:MAG: hypothetical protein KGJ98_13620 [Chloroflexota bacterium]|nr:hypothetical protein [Chloroflexota bacterium]MDE3103262.1 hypothetical protein [Chloroflexota bacterium]